MLEFAKKVLTKVSFDRDLFRKELKKAIGMLNGSESVVLYTWCIATFGDKYKDIIIQVFNDEQIWVS